MFSLLKSLFRKSKGNAESSIKNLPEAAFVVGISEGEIVNQRPEGKIERVKLSDLKAVIIETNDSGPWGADLWWILVGTEDSGCVFPGGATGEKEVLEEVQKLPGFDNKVFIEAMTSTSNQRFLCWTLDPHN